MRLFLALELPGPALDQLQRLQGSLKKYGRGKFVPRQNLHLTMVFLGDAEPEAVLQALAGISAHRQTLLLTGLGRFGDLVYAAARNTSALCQLQQSLTHALSAAGFSLEDRSFLPHITLCRKYAGSPPQIPALGTLGGARLVLMRSELQPNGAVYTVLHRF